MQRTVNRQGVPPLEEAASTIGKALAQGPGVAFYLSGGIRLLTSRRPLVDEAGQRRRSLQSAVGRWRRGLESSSKCTTETKVNGFSGCAVVEALARSIIQTIGEAGKIFIVDF
jgi:hypothetical protein